VTLPRHEQRMLNRMTALVLIGMTVAALWIGYRLGRGTAPRTSSSTRRSRRLGRLAVRVIVVMAASYLQQSLQKRLAMVLAQPRGRRFGSRAPQRSVSGLWRELSGSIRPSPGTGPRYPIPARIRL
jgi:hypothetical protein